MTSRRVVAELVSLASRAEPPSLDERVAHRLVERAIASGRRPEPARRTRVWLAVLAATAVGIAIAMIATRGSATAERLSTLALPTGDRVVALPDVRFEITRLEPSDRRLRLEDGGILVEVAHVAPGQRFEVTTPHLTAIAVGTVFAVETDADRSRVAVYEGTVVVEQSGRHVVTAGMAWDSGAHAVSATPDRTPFAAAIRDSLLRRAAAIGQVVSVAAPQPTVPVPVDANEIGVTRKPPEVKPPSLAQLLTRARADIAAGRFEAALATAKRAGALGGAWRLVRADAYRGLGRAADAASELDAAQRELVGADAIEAGYSAAYLRFRELHDADGALVTLVAANVDAQGSPLEERGLALHARLLESLGRRSEAGVVADRYIARFPSGDLRAVMERIARGAN